MRREDDYRQPGQLALDLARRGDAVHTWHREVHQDHVGFLRADAGQRVGAVGGSGQMTRFIVRASTTYEHISGLGQLSKGTPVEVHAVRNGDRWIATRIESNRGGSDDPPGDDHGSGGHGSDD